MTVHEADWVCPVTSPPIRDGAIAVEHGRIIQVGPASEVPGNDRVRHPGRILIPGFVNTHTHLELTIFHGLLENLAFGDWIAKLVRIKYGTLDREALKASARLGAIEMLQAGVTAVGEVMEAGTGWEAMLEFGLRGVAYQEVFGPAEDMAAESLRGLQGKVAAYRSQATETQRIGISPHAPYTVSKRLYELVRDFARAENLPMTAHIAESSEETKFVRDGQGHFADAHRKRGIEVTARHLSPVPYLDSVGLLGPDMLMVHVIEAEEGDLRRIRDRGASVSHCPKSNQKLGHGVAPVAEMRQLGIPVSVGTDSTASNDSIDMFAEMRLATTQQGIGADDAFRMVTLEGARALRLDQLMGSLDPGKLADFVVIEPKEIASDPVDGMMRSADRTCVKATFVGGVPVSLDDGEIRHEVERIKMTNLS
jgi:cytosine/adenosine deaminase-related metal-dependent hydrolase